MFKSLEGADMTDRVFTSLLFFSLTAGLATQANAQLVTYEFTGTKIEGTAGIGNVVVGTLTLDVGAAPEFVEDYPQYGGQFAHWTNGGFSIDGMTDTGFGGGTSLGWHTQFWNNDQPLYPQSSTSIHAFTDGYEKIIQVFSEGFVPFGDGIANVPNPWNPYAEQKQFIELQDYNAVTGVLEWGRFSLDTFAIPTTTIIIDGRDTGVDDFEYEGELVSELLSAYASGAKNHGDYVSRVARLTSDLKKAGLLTGAQKGLIVSYAAQSSIGK
jgi:hypothetical protein